LEWEGPEVPRRTVERLKRSQVLHGVMRGKVVRTNLSDSKAHRRMEREQFNPHHLRRRYS
jgi:hypothetical protein